MKKTFSLFFLLGSWGYSQTFNCSMNYRAIEASGQLIEQSEEMKTTAEDLQIQILEGQLQDRLFYVIWYKNNLEGLFQILKSDDVEDGIVLKSGLDMESRVRISEVKSNTTYQLSCYYN